MSFRSDVVFDSFCDLFADDFHLGLRIPVHIHSFLDGNYKSLTCVVHRFFIVRCGHGRVLLFCFTIQFLSSRFRRHHVLLLLSTCLNITRCRRRRVLSFSCVCLLNCGCFKVVKSFLRFMDWVLDLRLFPSMLMVFCICENIFVSIYVVQISFFLTA